jgi:hypothetical protein
MLIILFLEWIQKENCPSKSLNMEWICFDKIGSSWRDVKKQFIDVIVEEDFVSYAAETLEWRVQNSNPRIRVDGMRTRFVAEVTDCRNFIALDFGQMTDVSRRNAKTQITSRISNGSRSKKPGLSL